MSLCAACAGIRVNLLCHAGGYEHLSNAQLLFRTAKTCELCSLIRRALDLGSVNRRYQGSWHRCSSSQSR
ncbi:hypothetical protein QBC46DRAFT_168836 [Diplogelasinospora grovesii]|uniref:Uncharacterized protein n=1 Tax=Diplogelasinospora grovesii TaxID=303347 RepID=A0AAN6N5N8_9PEZI|nr:hypothetical protein QBC46DRAFT_168836 [Diplogelasinospora grovesii]